MPSKFISYNELIKVFILIMLVFMHFLYIKISPENNFSWVISLIICFIGMYSSRKTLPLLIIYIFTLSYLFIPYYYFYGLKQISIYDDYQRVHLINQVAFLNSLFLCFFTIFTKDLNDNTLLKVDSWCESNPYIFYLALALSIYSLLFGLTGDNLLNSNYGSGLSEKSALYEYFIVFFFFALMFRDKSSLLQLYSVNILLVLYCAKTLIYGGRIEVVQIGLLYLYVNNDFLSGYSKKKLLLVSFIAIISLKVIGNIRGDFLYFTGSELSFDLVMSVLFQDDANAFLMSTSSDVYYASMRLLGMKEDNLITFEDNAFSFLSFLFNILFTFSSFKDEANLAALNRNQFNAGGGGMITAYFYTWLGYFGVIGIAVFLGKIITQIHQSSSSNVIKIYGIFVLVTFPRWWSYSPINLTKLCLFSIILYGVIVSLKKIIMKSR